MVNGSSSSGTLWNKTTKLNIQFIVLARKRCIFPLSFSWFLDTLHALMLTSLLPSVWASVCGHAHTLSVNSGSLTLISAFCGSRVRRNSEKLGKPERQRKPLDKRAVSSANLLTCSPSLEKWVRPHHSQMSATSTLASVILTQTH